MMMKMVTSLLVLMLLGVVSVMSQSYGLSDDEKIEVVKAHNYYRGLVEPVATNMERMVGTLPCMYDCVLLTFKSL